MAQFEVIEDEGISFVKATLENETISAEHGALCHLFGDIQINARLPSVGNAVRSMLAEQSLIRPTFTGTGVIYLEGSVAGFEVFELDDNAWILERGAYWASDGNVRLAVHRERVLAAFWSGEGLLLLQTRVTGSGRIVLKTKGPVQVVDLNDERLVADGRYVLARTADIDYRIRRASRSFVGSMLSGERALRVFEGTGRVLLSSYPYWRYELLAKRDQG